MNLTKNNILKCVVEYLLNGEIEELSMSKVAAKINIGKSTIYEYFDSKEEIINEAIKYIVNDYLTRFLSCDMTKSFYEVYKEHIRCLLQFGRESKSFHNLIHHNGSNFFKNDKVIYLVNELMESFYQRIRSISQKGIDEKILCPANNEIKMNYLSVAFITGIVFNYSIGLINYPEEKVIDDFYEAIVKLINK